MHLKDDCLQMIIAQKNWNGFEIWYYLQKTFGQIKTSQIIVRWQEFLQNIVFKLQPADEKISDNLKIALVLKALA